MKLKKLIDGNKNRNEVEQQVTDRTNNLRTEIRRAENEGKKTLADIKRLQGAIKLAQAKHEYDSRVIDREVSKFIKNQLPRADPNRLNDAIRGQSDQTPSNGQESDPTVGADTDSEESIVEHTTPTKTIDSLIGAPLKSRLYGEVVVRILSSMEGDAEIPVYEDDNDNPGSFLFYGEPGTGKTHGAEGVAWALSELGHDVGFYPATGSQIKSSDFGESEQRLERLLRDADGDDNDISVVFIDEFEDVADRSGHRATAAIANTLQSLTSGTNVVESVVVIGATNHDDRVSSAIKNRFTRVKFPEPTREAKIRMLKRYLGDAQAFSAEEIRTLKNLDGLTGRDMKIAAKSAADEALLQNVTGQPTSIDDIQEARDQLQKSPKVSINEVKSAIKQRRT